MRRFRILIVDLVLIAAAGVIALLLRDNLEYAQERMIALLPYIGHTVLIAAVILPVIGADRVLWRFSGSHDYFRLVLGCGLIALTSVAVGFAYYRLEGVARSVPILHALLMMSLLVGLRVGMKLRRVRRMQISSAAQAGTAPSETVLVIGLNSVAELFLQSVTEYATQRVRVAGVLGRSDRHSGRAFRSHPVLGSPEELLQVVRDLEVHGVTVDRVVVAVAFDRLSRIAQHALLEVEKGDRIVVDFFSERVGLTAQPRPLGKGKGEGGSPGAAFGVDLKGLDAALQRPYWRMKRAIDVAIATLAILAVMPLMLLVGCITVVLLGPPVLFWQQRPGLNGRPFRLYKIRSLLGAHDEAGRRLPDADRETAYGRFLRATRIDELPQFFSIMAGHMSFVGPRPLLPCDQPEQFSARLRVRPGLTGWAQVNGGKGVSALDKMALDIWYIRHASLWLDLRIVAMTVRTVVLGEKQSPAAVETAWAELNVAVPAADGRDMGGLIVMPEQRAA